MKAKTRSAVSATIGVFCLFFTASAFAAAKHVTLSCSGYTGTTTLTNFQALVKLAEGVGGFSYSDCAANDGSDLWFTDASGTTVYPHEVDTWNTSGESFVWVRLPEVLPTSGGLHTTFTMHWGDLAAKQTTSENAWKNYNDGKGGFAGVWHMNSAGGTATEPDSTDNGLTGTPQGANPATAMTNAVGVVGVSRANRGSDSALLIPAYSSTLTSPANFTISGWWNLAAWDTYPRFFVQANDKWQVNLWNTFGDTYIQGLVSGGATTGWNGSTKKNAPRTASFVNTWMYLTVVFNGTTVEIYSNGSKRWTKTDATANEAYEGGFRIGNSSTLTRPWYGYYDEVRMYDGVQTADRIKADYDTMNTPDSFLTFVEAHETTLRATGYAGTTTLTNFQTLVKISESVGGFSYAQCAANYGADLWFTDSAGNVIPHEVDTWNTSGDSLVWVRLPELSPVAQGATSFTMHWGDLAAKQTTSVNVWKNYNDGKGGFAGVWHMGTASGTANEPDATGNGLDAVPTVNYGTGDLAAMTTTPGIVGNGRINQTSNAYVQGLKVPDYSANISNASKFTISGWWTATALNTYPRFASAEGATHYWAIVGWNTNNNNINMWKKIQGVYSNGETKNGGSVTTAFAIDSFRNDEGNWVYLTVVWDGTTLTAYSNGAQKYQNTSMVAQTTVASGFMIGGDSAAASANPAWRGYYDEVRMYDGVQSADRIKADYDTMSDPDTFVTYTTIATWTGAANDGNGANPLNWECSNNGVVVVGQLPNATYRIQSCTLSRDCDWSGLGTVYLAKGAVIEMDGHSLTLPAVAGEGTVQNSAAGDAKELTLFVPSDWINTDVSFSGNLKLVKAGAGTFTSSKAQTYAGGTIVAAGTAQPPARTASTDLTHTWDNFKAFGTGEITVNSGATFDVRGQYGYRNIITLNGGTWMSTSATSIDGTRNDYSGVWRLTDDSFINVPTFGFVIGNPGDLLDLDGHTLTVSVASGKYFNSKFSYTGNPGTVILEGAGYGISTYENSTILATNVDFRISASINLGVNCHFHVHDYIALNTDRTIHANSGSKFCVYGTFKPNSANNYFCGPEMQDNTVIDLSGMSGPWSIKSGGSNLVNCKYVTFADGAKVSVNLGSRKVATDVAIMTWDAASKPANLDTLAFKGVFNDRTVTLSKREDGLYLPRGLVIIVR